MLKNRNVQVEKLSSIFKFLEFELLYVIADWFDAGSLGCYKFLEGKVNLTWVEAQLACEQQGGYLAEPTSQL